MEERARAGAGTGARLAGGAEVGGEEVVGGDGRCGEGRGAEVGEGEDGGGWIGDSIHVQGVQHWPPCLLCTQLTFQHFLYQW